MGSAADRAPVASSPCTRGGRKALATTPLTLQEFLAGLPHYRPGRVQRRAIVHGHCDQKALVGMEPTWQVLSKVEGLEFSILDSGCRGMAGALSTRRATTR